MQKSIPSPLLKHFGSVQWIYGFIHDTSLCNSAGFRTGLYIQLCLTCGKANTVVFL